MNGRQYLDEDGRFHNPDGSYVFPLCPVCKEDDAGMLLGDGTALCRDCWREASQQRITERDVEELKERLLGGS